MRLLAEDQEVPLPETAPIRQLSIVIPALNERDGIGDIARRVLSVREALAAAGVGALELIVVDDGSTDGTAQAAEAVGGLTVIKHATNRGYGAAIKTGFREAGGDVLAFLDADGTYPPESFPDLCSALVEEGADIVVGSRMSGMSSEMPRTRRIGNRFFAKLVSLVGATQISDSASGQRVLRREALERVYPLPDGLNFTPVMTTRAIHEGLHMIEVPITYTERVGESKLSVVRDGQRFLSTILWTALEYNPARILGMAGLALVALGGVFGIGLLALRASGTASLGPWGIASAYATLLFGVVGLALVNLGIVFNYLVSLFHRQPVRQGLFGRPLVPGLDRWFGWLGAAATVLGVLVAGVSLFLGISGWDLTRLWLWLLGSALFVLTGVQLMISWILMRVLEELAGREAALAGDLAVAAGRVPAEWVVEGAT
jgi:hypothetical protein